MNREINEAPQLPTLVRGQQIRNGPFTITVTKSMVQHRNKENRDLLKHWQEEQRRRNMQEMYSGKFAESDVRRQFIRKVFLILSLQLVFTVLIVSIFLFIEEARKVLQAYPFLWMIALGVFIFSYITVSCCNVARRKISCNIILLVLLTVSLSYLTAVASVHYTLDVILITASITLLITGIICFIVTFTKFDMTKRSGFLVIISIAATVTLIAMVIAYCITNLSILQMGIAIVAALLITIFLYFDLQTIMGGKTIQINPEEYVYATTQLYVDILMLYRYTLIFWGGAE